MNAETLEIALFGPCFVRTTGSSPLTITGNKHRALFALLATAPSGVRTRAYLQEMLWGKSSFDGGRQSLRRALSDIRKCLGPLFEQVILTSHSDVTLRFSAVRLIGDSSRGPFLDGVTVREPAFTRWVDAMRREPAVAAQTLASTDAGPCSDLRPSIAILPFQFVLGGTDHRGIGDWLAADVSRFLTRSSLLSVISHLSCREMASQDLVLSDVRRNLSVDYCVTGSVRPVADKILVDVDLCDTSSGRVLVTRRFVGRLEEMIGLNTELTVEMGQSIALALIQDSAAVSWRCRPTCLDDHRLLLSGIGLMHQPTMAGFARSRSLFEEAARRSPRNGEVHAWLAKWYVLSVFNGWSPDRAADTARAESLAKRAVSLDPQNAFCRTIDGFVQGTLLRRWEAALTRYADALDTDPNQPFAWLLKGALHAFTGDSDMAVSHVDWARRLSPMDPFKPFFQSLSATAHFAQGNDYKALDLVNASLEGDRRLASTYRVRAAVLQRLGRDEEARAAARALLVRQPGFTVSGYLRRHPAAAFPAGQEMASALRGAGIPE